MSKVLAVINGMVITTEMRLQARKDQQRKHLQDLIRDISNLVKPGFVWTFLNPTIFPYHGWWLYVITHKGSWLIDDRRHKDEFALKIMNLYPCGFLPINENIRPWKETFAQFYPRATLKRPDNQGMAKVRVTSDVYGRLLDISYL